MNPASRNLTAGRYLQLAAYDCLGWSGLDVLSTTLSMLKEKFRLLPLEHKEREVSGQTGRGLMGDRQLLDHLRDNIAQTRAIFRKSPSTLGVTGKLYLKSRVGILQGSSDFLPSWEDAMLNLEATEFKDGSSGFALSFSLAQPLQFSNSSTEAVTNVVMEMYSAISVELGLILRPSYIWIDMDHRESPPKPSSNDIRSVSVPTMYWSNYFGRPFLEVYGKKFFLDAPGWRKVELPMGAVIVQLGPSFTSSVDAGEPDEVLSYFKTLGVTYVAWPSDFTDGAAG